jgi:hypothetical protein
VLAWDAKQGIVVNGVATDESLGNRQIEDLDTIGRRITLTVPPRSKSDKAAEMIDERWESSDLKVLISAHSSDTRWGEIDYRLTKIRRVEPPEDLFLVPADYTLEYSGWPQGQGRPGRAYTPRILYQTLGANPLARAQSDQRNSCYRSKIARSLLPIIADATRQALAADKSAAAWMAFDSCAGRNFQSEVPCEQSHRASQRCGSRGYPAQSRDAGRRNLGV